MMRVVAWMVVTTMLAVPAWGQTSNDPDEVFVSDGASVQDGVEPPSKNPDNVSNRLEDINTPRKDVLFETPGIDRVLAPWQAAKKRLLDDYGLSLGFFYTALYEKADRRIIDPIVGTGLDEGAGGVIGMVGSWELVGRGTDSPGFLSFQVQNRHRMGPVVPQSLGFEIGSLWPTAIGYSELELSVVELYWNQFLIKDRWNIAFGKAIPFGVHDYFAYKSPFTGFNNATFTLNPTISFVSAGLGAGMGLRPADDVYILAAFYDAKGKLNRAGFESFFDDAKYFTAVDIGWDPGYLDPTQKVTIGPITVRDVHATFWHKAHIPSTGSPEGWGFTLFAEGEIGRFVPFLRYGYSDGTSLGNPAILDHMIAGGVGITKVFGQSDDLIGIGFSWGRKELVPEGVSAPVDLDGDGIPDFDFADVARDLVRKSQYASEIFYRVQVTNELQITPSVQFIWDPILDVEEDFVAVFGIRGRLDW